jgi:hypothetical protein
MKTLLSIRGMLAAFTWSLSWQTDAMSLSIICTQIYKKGGGFVRTLDDINWQKSFELINVGLIFNNTWPVGYDTALLRDESEVLKISDVRTGKTWISEGLNPISLSLSLYSTMYILI